MIKTCIWRAWILPCSIGSNAMQGHVKLDIRSNNQWKENAFFIPKPPGIGACSFVRDNIPGFMGVVFKQTTKNITRPCRVDPVSWSSGWKLHGQGKMHSWFNPILFYLRLYLKFRVFSNIMLRKNVTDCLELVLSFPGFGLGWNFRRVEKHGVLINLTSNQRVI